MPGSTPLKAKKQQLLMLFFKPASLLPAKAPDGNKENITPPSSQPASSPIRREPKPPQPQGTKRAHEEAKPADKPAKRVKQEVEPEEEEEEDDDEDMDLPHVSEDLGDEFVAQSSDSDADDLSDAVPDSPEPPTDHELDDDDDIVVKPKRRSQPRSSPTPRLSSRGPMSSPVPRLSSQMPPSSPSGSLAKFSSALNYQAPALGLSPLRTPSKLALGSKFAKINEERYQWLLTIKDAEKRTEDDPEYDPRTLYIPQLAWLKFTAFERQYWEIKSKMWDTVVFFKKGKFYELYENDAVIANTQFDLKIAGGGRANMQLAGIPEMLFEYWAKQFIDAGYKVAKVDQKESLLAKEMRGGGTKEEKIIKRELTGVLTGGTLTDLDMLNGDLAVYCMAIWQEPLAALTPQFGVAVVDVALGHLQLSQIDDDRDCTQLETIVLQLRPKEVVVAKHNLSPLAHKIVKQSGKGNQQLWNAVNPITEFWDTDTARDYISKANWYPQENPDDMSNYPKVLAECIKDYQTAFLAFSGLLWYLTTLKLDTQILSLGNITWYSAEAGPSHMNIDGTSLENLEVLANCDDGLSRGTLLKLVNRAQTPMGKRRMRQWVMAPLARAKSINERLDAVEFLMNNSDVRQQIERALDALPDTERLLARVHAGTLRFREFVKVVELLEAIVKFRKLKENVPADSALGAALKAIPHELAEVISKWEDAFDRKLALNDEVVPSSGVDADFDSLQNALTELESQLAVELKKLRDEFGLREIVYKDLGKEIYLIELPNRLVSKVPDLWMQMGLTSKVKRYWLPSVKKLARQLMEQREIHKVVCALLRTNLYRQFSQDFEIYKKAVDAVSIADAIVALTRVLELLGSPASRPKFVDNDIGHLRFENLTNPMHTRDFIPNDVELGGETPRIGLLTGANAAGKLTLMRTTAIAVILAQLGCYVPASYAELVPVDRIMTRLGASDNILGGQLTFYVELAETKKILSQATPKLLVIIDELGRGGLSSDGFAIAEAVLYHLATHTQPLGYFATHFGGLVDAFNKHPEVKPLRMAINVDDENRQITFLYKLEPGRAPGLFGMHVAAMCGIKQSIVDAAEVASARVAEENKLIASNSKEPEELGVLSDVAWYVSERSFKSDRQQALSVLMNWGKDN